MNAEPITDRNAWLARRRGNIGGSEIAALFGCQADYQMSAYTLWQTKAGRIAERDVTDERPMWGWRLEEVIADAVAEEWEWLLGDGGYVVHPTVPGLACTLDRTVLAHPERDGIGVLELKNIDWLVHRREWVGEPPTHISLQLQHQLACTGQQWGAVVALIGGNHLSEPYYFERRPRIIAEIERLVTAFWQSIDDDVEPPVDGSDSTAETLRDLFPTSIAGRTYDATGNNEFGERVADLRQARADLKAAEAIVRASTNWIYDKIKDAEVVTAHGEVILTAKSSNRKGYTVEPGIVRTIRLKETA